MLSLPALARQPARPNTDPRQVAAALDRVVAHARDAGPHGDREAATVRIIAANAEAPAARLIWARLPQLAEAGVAVTACFARLPRQRATCDAVQAFADIYGSRAAARSLRIARFARSGGVYEQALFGREALWTGARLAARPLRLDRGLLSGVEAEGANRARATMSAARALFVGVWMRSRPLADTAWRRVGPIAVGAQLLEAF